MSMEIGCPQCHTVYHVPDEQAGKRVRCKKCDNVFIAGAAGARPKSPGSQEITVARPRASTGAEDDKRSRPERKPSTSSASSSRRSRPRDIEDEDALRPRRKKAQRGFSPLALVLILGGVFGSILAIGICIGLVIWLVGKASPPQAQDFKIREGPNIAMGPWGGDNPNEGEDEPKENAPKTELALKDPEPLPPAPSHPEFISPALKEASITKPATGPAKAELDPDVVQRVKQSTVYLRVTMPDNNIGQGSGFFGIERNLILTNAHVVGMLRSESKKPKSIEVVRNKGTPDEKRAKAELIGLDRASDLALLRVSEADPPPPLEIKSAKNLRETQRVWVAGFPLGEQPGKEISLSDSSVSSLRWDENKSLVRVQVNGGMQPGNSGGPVVDAYGNVIGVAVAILRGTQINFAIPGDTVRALESGRITNLVIGQPYVSGDAIRAPIRLRVIDPLKRLHSLAVEVWTGDPKPDSRDPSNEKPSPLKGDSAHVKQSLKVQGGHVQEEIALPELPDGKVYWIQPSWSDSKGITRWATARAYEIAPPVEQKAAQLNVKLQPGNGQRVTINRWLNVKYSDENGEYNVFTNTEAGLSEKVQNIANDDQANVRLQYDRFNSEILVEKQTAHDPNQQRVRQDIRKLISYLLVDKQGNPVSQNIESDKVPANSRNHVLAAHQEIQQLYQALLIPLPNKPVAPGETWKAERAPPSFLVQGPFLHPAAFELSYTYVGTRKHQGHEQAIITFKGTGHGADPLKRSTAGNVDGSAVLDLGTGQVVQVDGVYSFEMDAQTMMPGRPVPMEIKATGSMTMRLRRSPVSVSPGA